MVLGVNSLSWSSLASRYETLVRRCHIEQVPFLCLERSRDMPPSIALATLHGLHCVVSLGLRGGAGDLDCGATAHSGEILHTTDGSSMASI